MTDDDGAGSSFKYTGNADKSSTRALRLQVRLVSGKVVGPFSRDQVISLINRKKLNGEESVLFDGEGTWRAISSDNDFFDAFQARLEGRQVEIRKRRKKTQNPEATRKLESPDTSANITRTRVGQDADLRPEDEVVPTPSRMEAPETPPTRPEEPVKIELETIPEEPVPEAETAHKKKVPLLAEQRRRAIIFIVLCVLGGLLVIQGLRTNGRSGSRGMIDYGELKLPDDFLYPRNLAVFLTDLQLKFPPMPDDVINSGDVKLSLGFGASYWIADLRALSEAAGGVAMSQSSYWIRLLWSARWLAGTLMTFDERLGKQLRDESQRIYDQLDKRKLLSPSLKTLFAAIPALEEGQ